MASPRRRHVRCRTETATSTAAVVMAAVVLACAATTAVASDGRLHEPGTTYQCGGIGTAAHARTEETPAASRARLASRIDTEGWVGAEYTPSTAGGNLFWQWYSDFEDQMRSELTMAQKVLGYNTVRMFLQYDVYARDDGKTLIPAVSRFLDLAASLNYTVGLVYFDDCHNDAGANLTAMCVPQPGFHNGCWFTSPQAVDRTDIPKFKPYVDAVASAFGRHPTVGWLEVYNEPHKKQAGSISSCDLRHAARGWTMAHSPTVPVISCWGDNADTDVTDVHDYTTAFDVVAANVYVNASKGAIITEGGSRWWPGQPSDQGSPLTYIHFMRSLRARKASGAAPYVPGIMINWEVMVGNSNTRWHWGTPTGAPEPAIPWDGTLFPDGTPVSLTEAAAILNYTTGRDVAAYMETFLPPPDGATLLNGDQYLQLGGPSGETQWAAPASAGPFGDGWYEAAVWPNETSGKVGLLLRASGSGDAAAGVFIGLDAGARNGAAVVESWDGSGGGTTLHSFDMSSIACGLERHGWNMLRVKVQAGTASVYVNPMWTDTQVGPFPSYKSKRIAPRFEVTLPAVGGGGGGGGGGGLRLVARASGGGGAGGASGSATVPPARVDYVSAYSLSAVSTWIGM